MVFNADKFEILRNWPKTGNKTDNSYTEPDGNQIEEKDHLHNLGVEIRVQRSMLFQNP